MLPEVLCCVCQSRLCWVEYPGAVDASPTSPAEEREHGREDEGDDDGERVAMDASATGPVEQREHGRKDEGGNEERAEPVATSTVKGKAEEDGTGSCAGPQGAPVDMDGPSPAPVATSVGEGKEQEEKYESCATARLPGAPVATGGAETRGELEAANAQIQGLQMESAARVAELESWLRWWR